MIIIKIGGGKDININGIVNDVYEHLRNEEIIIVHGANALRDELSEKLGFRKQVITSVKGYSSVFSNKELIDLQLMSYSGLKNKRIVELFQKKGINAIGLTGLDGGLIKGVKNKGIRIKKGEKTLLVKDFSGKPKSVNHCLMNLFLSLGILPILTVPIMGEDGTALNSENDDIVKLLAESFETCKIIIHLIEAKGLLKNENSENSLIKKLNKTELLEMEEKVSGRMKRKLMSLRKILEKNQHTSIIISDGRVKNPIKSALNKKGTKISNE